MSLVFFPNSFRYRVLVVVKRAFRITTGGSGGCVPAASPAARTACNLQFGGYIFCRLGVIFFAKLNFARVFGIFDIPNSISPWVFGIFDLQNSISPWVFGIFDFQKVGPGRGSC